jgi:MFS transporter, DHA3 family, macrolide efflux protein
MRIVFSTQRKRVLALFLIGLVLGGLYELAVILLLITGLTSPIFNGSVIAVMQSTIPPKMQGRVFSLILSGASAMSPIGLAVAGPVADAFGVPIWFVVSGLVTAILSTAALFLQ